MRRYLIAGVCVCYGRQCPGDVGVFFLASFLILFID
jgi:hypothetical protein